MERNGADWTMKDKHGNEFERIKLLISILKRGDSDRLIPELRGLGITFNMASVGYWATGLDMADFLGLTETEHDIIYSVVPVSKVRSALSMIEFKFSLNERGNGIAFCIPITGVGGPVSLKYLSGITASKEGIK
jgi:hypothetical protein